MLLSDGFLETARKRLNSSEELIEADLRRALSDLYYALFHTICETLAGILTDPYELAASKEAWLRLYRLPDHRVLANACDDGRISEFPNEIQHFAAQLKAMKTRREDADYDVTQAFQTSDVRKTLELVETAIRGFKNSDAQSRLKFAVFVALRKRGA